MTENEVRALLKLEIMAAGSARAWCQQTGVPEGHVSLVLRGRAPPYPCLVEALGLERVVSYRSADERQGA